MSFVDRIVYRFIHRTRHGDGDRVHDEVGGAHHGHGDRQSADATHGPGVRHTPGPGRTDDLIEPGRFSGEHADRYAQRSRTRSRTRFYRRIARDVARLAPPDGHVLDVGTGPGTLLLEIARSRPDLRATGVDVEPAMVRTAAQAAREESLADRVAVHAADVTDLPLAAAGVDVVVATLTAHHWPDVRAAVHELVRVLRPGGTLLVVDFGSVVHEPLVAALAAAAPTARVERSRRWAWGLPALATWEARIRA